MQTEITRTTETDELHYDEANDRFELSYDPEGSATLLTTIVHGLTSVVDVDVSQGEFSLYDSVDPDALERIFSPKADGEARTGGHVAFTALECEVYVHANGDIYIHPPPQVQRPN
ncbi:HalOD1 output domain-containing protein [Halovivax limisalsi]|uniref:HalOD1 output domain-containing protein n=1 Tax=Halovivax limisalsi TaxID=1453760 RepID=UPI001FFC8769|nr:HalOD1 output domain-containing protein [Halovivax limisalsi]